ncbi:MAG: hypothetical protein RL095_2965 [Verrucomicrobiota bacterium]
MIMWLDYMILMTVSLPVIILPLGFFAKGYCDDNSNIQLSMFFVSICTFFILLIPCVIGTAIILLLNLINILKDGQTLGQKILKTRTADEEKLLLPSIGKNLLRYIDFTSSILIFSASYTSFIYFCMPIYLAFLIPPLFIFLFMLLDFLVLVLPGHRSLRDRISNTTLVYVSLNPKTADERPHPQ